MQFNNIHLILGNHEIMMIDAINNIKQIECGIRTDYDNMNLWLNSSNGGKQTWESYNKLSLCEQQKIIDYLEESSLIHFITYGNATFHLSHAYTYKGIDGSNIFYKDSDPFIAWTIVWQSVFSKYFLKVAGKDIYPTHDYIYVMGHTFTQMLLKQNEYGQGRIYHNNDYKGFKIINLDCGIALRNETSRLGCLRIDDFMEFYV